MADQEVEHTQKKPLGGGTKKSKTSRKSSATLATEHQINGDTNQQQPEPEQQQLPKGLKIKATVDEIHNSCDDTEDIVVAYVKPRQQNDDGVRRQTLPSKDLSLLNEIDENKLLELKEAFILFDLDQDGVIDKNDLLFTFKSLGQTDVTDADVTKMLAEAHNPLDFDSFVTLLGYKTIELDTEETLVAALAQWDYDDSGFISDERIRHDLMTRGDKFTQKEVDVALEDAPISKNKGQPMIDYKKFCENLCGLRKRSKKQSD